MKWSAINSRTVKLAVCTLVVAAPVSHAARKAAFDRIAEGTMRSLVSASNRCIETFQLLRNEMDVPLPRTDILTDAVGQQELRAAVDWAKQEQLTGNAAIRQAIKEKNPHARPLIRAALEPKQARSAIGSSDYAFIPPDRKLFRFAVRHGAPRSILHDLVAAGSSPRGLFFLHRDPYILKAFGESTDRARRFLISEPTLVERASEAGFALTFFEAMDVGVTSEYRKVMLKTLERHPEYAVTDNGLGDTLEMLAAAHDNVELVSKLIELGSLEREPRAAAGNDAVNVLKFYHKKYPELLLDPQVMEHAALMDSFEAVKFLWEVGNFADRGLLDEANRAKVRAFEKLHRKIFIWLSKRIDAEWRRTH